jgi:hypothetical protein
MSEFSNFICNKIVPYDYFVDYDNPTYIWVGDFPYQHEELVIPVEDEKFYLLAFAEKLPPTKRYLVPKYTEAQKSKLYTVALQSNAQNAQSLANKYGFPVADIPQPVVQTFSLGMLIYNKTNHNIEQYLYDNSWMYFSTITQTGV